MEENPHIIEVEKVIKPILKSCLKKPKKNTTENNSTAAASSTSDKTKKPQRKDDQASWKTTDSEAGNDPKGKQYDPCEVCFPKKQIVETFDMRKHVKEREVIHDEDETYLKLRKTLTLMDDKDLHSEILSKLQFCTKIFHVCIHQKILFEQNECQVRMSSVQNEVEMKTRLARANLSLEMKQYLSYLSEECLELLSNVGILCDSIVLDVCKKASIINTDKEVRVKVPVHLLSLSDTPVPWPQDIIPVEEKHDDEDDYAYLKVSSSSLLSKMKATERKVSRRPKPPSKKKRHTHYPISAVQIIFSLRNSIPAQEVFRQYLVSMIDPCTNTYILLCQVGPLVQGTKLALYQYYCNNKIKTLSKSLSEPLTFTPKREMRKKSVMMNGNDDEMLHDKNEEEAEIEKSELAMSGSGCMVINDHIIHSELENMIIDNRNDKKNDFLYDNEVLKDQTVVQVEDSDGEQENVDKNKQSSEISKIERVNKPPSKIKNIKTPSQEMNYKSSRQPSSERQTNDSVTINGSEGQHIGQGKTTLPKENETVCHEFTMKQVLDCWQENEGKLVYKLTDLKDCIRHSIHTNTYRQYREAKMNVGSTEELP